MMRGEKFHPYHGWAMINPPGGQRGSTLDYFVEVVSGDKQSVCPVEDSRTTLAVCLAFYEAAKEHKAIYMNS